MRDTGTDALASGSGPSESRTAGQTADRTGESGDSASVSRGQIKAFAGQSGQPNQEGNQPEGTADTAPDGRLDHHKDKKGRKRRRRRKGAQRNSVPASPVVVQADADGSPDGQNPPSAPHGKKRRRRRRKKVMATDTPMTQTVADGSAAQPGQVAQAGTGRETVSPPRMTTARRPHGGGQTLYAALDLGTNNCRLLVATPTRPGQFRVVDAFSRIVRLGEGLSRTGQLSTPAMDRAIEALKVCSDKLNLRPMRRTRLIATEACRSAENGEDFLRRVREETGLSLEIVDRETEARLAVSGCSSLVGRETDSVVLFDIGGGSSEVALVDVKERRSRRLSDHIVAWTSLKIGVVTLSEKFGGCEVTPQIFADMVDYSAELLSRFEQRDRLADRVGNDGFHLLGTSGTVTTLAGIHLDLPRYDRRRVDGLWMSSGEVDAMNAKLLSWSYEERIANPCIGSDRADLVLAGCAILEAIRNTWPSKRLRVADRGLREGILTEMMAADGAWRRNTNPWRSRPHWNAK